MNDQKKERNKRRKKEREGKKREKSQYFQEENKLPFNVKKSSKTVYKNIKYAK